MQQRSKIILTTCALLSEPSFFLYCIAKDLLYRYFHLPKETIFFFATVVPTLPIISFYINKVFKKNFSIKTCLIITSFLGKLLFLFVFLFKNGYYFLVCSIICIIFTHAHRPFWMEGLKQNISPKNRYKWLNFTYMFQYVEYILILLIFKKTIEAEPDYIPLLIALLVLPSILSTIALNKININSPQCPKTEIQVSWISRLYNNRSFAKFHLAAFVCGAAVVLLNAVKVIYMKDILATTYSECFYCYICDAIGVLFFSPLLYSQLQEKYFLHLSSLTFLLFALHPIFLFLGSKNILFIYPAYLVYGCAKAGSHSIWNSAPLILTGESDSYEYTAINNIILGLRGLVMIPLGIITRLLFGFDTLFILSALLSLSSIFVIYNFELKKHKVSNT